jgi:hypothetical protein
MLPWRGREAARRDHQAQIVYELMTRDTSRLLRRATGRKQQAYVPIHLFRGCRERVGKGLVPESDLYVYGSLLRARRFSITLLVFSPITEPT